MKFISKLFITISLTFGMPFSMIFAKEVILGGENIGIELDFEGVLVTGTYDIEIDNKNINPEDYDIKKGDYILKINGIKVNDSKDLITYFQKLDETSKVTLDIKRNNQMIKRELVVYKNDDTFKTGLMIKDHILGIGTVSFYDPSDNTYGALGHEISDSSTKEVVPIEGGVIYESHVTGIKSSKNGTPGEKIASIKKDEVLGDVLINSIYGIYGNYNDDIDGLTIETAKYEDIKLGKAYIYTVLKDDVKEKYEIEITNLEKQNIDEIKGISFKITDPRLLNKTNGIVQGMSGSPIVQNNLLIGAVTHVKVNDVQSGYGIYIENMLNAKDNN